MTISKIQAGVLEVERKKLRAIQDKIPRALDTRSFASMTGLAQSAERVAARLVILLDQIKHQWE